MIKFSREMATVGHIVRLVEAALEKDDETAAVAALMRVGGTVPTAHEARRLALLARSIDRNDLGLAALAAAGSDRQSILLAFQLRSELGEAVADELAVFLAASAGAGPQLLQLIGALEIEGRSTDAIRLLADAVAYQPDWVAGHQALAQLRFQAGETDPSRGFGEALAIDPRNEMLWAAWLGTVGRTCDWALFRRASAVAARHFPASRLIAMVCADGLSEMGQEAEADRLFSQLETVDDPQFDAARMRHAMRYSRFAKAAKIGERAVRSHGGGECWGWLGAAWRLAGDPRGDWFYRGGDLVQVAELLYKPADLKALASLLHGLHRSSGPPLGQSPRGGTQTPGPLFKRSDPEIRLLRRKMKHAVKRYIGQLPPLDAEHPFLRASRRAFRFQGAWSIRLRAGGRHVSHIHSQGWISSAFYVELPEGMHESPRQEGWLQFGVPPLPEGQEIVPPIRMVAPEAARLALFPSVFWHGTRPFRKGERLTVAFDVVPR